VRPGTGGFGTVMESHSLVPRRCPVARVFSRVLSPEESGGTGVCTGGAMRSESRVLPEGGLASIHICPYIQKIRIWCIQGDLFSITG